MKFFVISRNEKSYSKFDNGLAFLYGVTCVISPCVEMTTLRIIAI